jgi:hypothetical protein
LIGKENRYLVLKELYHDSYKLTDLSKIILGQEKAEANKIQKPVDLLLKRNIIDRNSEGKLSITNLGKRLYEMIEPIILVWEQRNYFEEHIIDEPFSLFFSGSSIKNMKIIDGTPSILRQLMNVYSRAENYLFNILYDIYYNKELLDILTDNLNKENFHAKTIFGENSKRDPDWINIYQSFKKYKLDGKIEQKLIERINTSLILTDTEGLIFFPSGNPSTPKKIQKPDTHSAIYFRNNKYLQFCCLDYFNTIWSNAGPFDHMKIK